MAEESTVPTDVLDGLRNEIGQQAQQMAVTPPEEPDEPEEPEEEQEDEAEGEDAPEGFKSYEEYVADGGDPEYYRGPKAFKQQKEILADLKEIKEKVKARDDEMLKLQQLHEREKKRLIDEIEAKKKQAREDFDFDEYDKLESQRRELESEQAPKQSGEPEPIQSFRSENAVLDPASTDFDPVFNSAFESAFNTQAAQVQQRLGRQLDEREITQLLERTKERLMPTAERPKRTPNKVAGTKRTPKKEAPIDKMPEEIKGLVSRWQNHHDPRKRKQAETWLKQYGG